MKRERGIVRVAETHSHSRATCNASGPVGEQTNRDEKRNETEEDGRDTNVQNRFWKGEGGPHLIPREG